MSPSMKKHTFYHVRPTKTDQHAQSDQSLRCPHEETLHS